MEHALEHINPSQIKDFFRSLCLVSNRYKKKEHPVYETLKHLEKKHFKTLEKKSEAAIEKDLEVKINRLERELHQTKKERDKAVGENREQIHELNVSLLSIKTRMNEILEYKRQRERRIRELERKIRKTVR